MPSTPTPRNYVVRQAPGENGNTWGDILNAGGIDVLDYALDGMASFALSGPKTLAVTNYTACEANARFLNITSGTGGTITIPNTEKLRLVRNATTGDVILTTGAVGATNATVPAGVIAWVISEGTNIARTITASNNFGTTGIIINGQTLDGLTAAGVAMAEAADAAAQRTLLALQKAVAAEVYAMSADKVLTAAVVGDAFAPVGLAYAATLAWDWRGGYYRGPVVCTGNITIALPTSIRAGETRMMDLEGNDATARTVAFATGFKGVIPTIQDMTSTKKFRLVFTADTGGTVTVASELRS